MSETRVELRLRDADEADLDAVAALHVAAWRDTYGGSVLPWEILDRIDIARRRARGALNARLS